MNLKINDRIRVRNVEGFNNFSLSLRYDSVASTFNFDFTFDPKNPEHRELACVSHFHEAFIEHNGERLITGIILSNIFSMSPAKKMIPFAGYSLPGVFEDCEIPVDLYPLQSDGLTLREIASKLIKPFGLKMVVDSSVASRMDKPYKTATAKESQKIKEFLCELASQRNIIMSHDETGALVFTEAKTNKTPILVLTDETIPGIEAFLTFSGQQLHSHITVMKQADSDGGNAGQVTVRNPFVPIVYRPRTIIQTAGDDNDTELAARMALSEELKNIFLTVTVDRWELDGKLIRPNNTIRMKRPDLFLFKEVDWFIEQVDYTGDQAKQTCVLRCVLPEVYTNAVPRNIFVDPHQNFPRV